MKRKEFIKSSLLISGGLFFQGSKLLAYIKKDSFTFEELRNGIGFYTNSGGTIGWMVHNDGVVVIDTQFPDTAKIFEDQLKKKSSGKIDILFNTHHHRDHTAGNPYLSKYSQNIVANTNCVRLQKTRNVGKELDKNKVYANKTFDENWSIDLGKEKLFAYHFGPAHTGGDSIFHFVNSNVVHMGDLVFNRVYPWVNKDDEASLSGWIEYLDDAVNRFDNDTLFIFGHSYSPEKVHGGKDDLKFMRNYIEALLNYVKQEKKNGKKDEDILKTESIPKFTDMKALWKGALQANIKAALIELAKT